MDSIWIIAAWTAVVWAVLALAVQLIEAFRGRRRDLARRAGDPGRGVVYNFTVAMDPRRKETAGRHPLEYAIGLLMHAGALLGFAAYLVLLVDRDVGSKYMVYLSPLWAVSFITGAILLIRRATNGNMRYISVPDDYLAIVMTCAFLALLYLRGLVLIGVEPLLGFGALLFLYIPLGKLRHIVYFFVVRADYGFRLGYRGVYPPEKMEGRRVD